MKARNLVTGAEDQLHDADLALAWIYGDVVHHDPDRRKASDPFGLAERHKAATPLVAGLMVSTMAQLNRVMELNKVGRIPVAPAIFDEPVALEDTTSRYQGPAARSRRRNSRADERDRAVGRSLGPLQPAASLRFRPSRR